MRRRIRKQPQLPGPNIPGVNPNDPPLIRYYEKKQSARNIRKHFPRRHPGGRI